VGSQAKSTLKSSLEYAALRISQELKFAPRWVETLSLIPLAAPSKRSAVLRALMPYRATLRAALIELSGEDPRRFVEEFEEAVFIRKIRPWARLEVGTTSSMLLYCLVRATKPAVVVETGVSSGFSSAIILAGMHANHRGRLYSIEKFRYPLDLKGKECGWLVPLELRERWQLIVGSSEKELPLLLDQIGTLDLFFHDSNHSYDNMTWELSIAWPRMSSSGILLADNVNFNFAFRDFCERHGRIPLLLDYTPGLPNSIELLGAVKRGDEKKVVSSVGLGSNRRGLA